MAEAKARLDQQSVLANMEMQARQQISEREALQHQERLAIEQAYHATTTGLAKQRIDQASSLAAAKAAEAAKSFSDEQQLAAHVASGGKLVEGLSKFPRAKPGFINALNTASPDEKAANVPKGMNIQLPNGDLVPAIVNTKTGHFELHKAADEVEMTQPMDPNNPFGPKVKHKVPMSQARVIAGTNATSLFGPETPAAAKNPYIKGRRYGKLTYLGGDPTDESNWKKAE